MGMMKNRIVDTFTCYEEFAEDYDQWKEFGIITQTEERTLLSLIGNVERKRILDVGCGTGRYTKRFEDLGAPPLG